MTQSIKRDRPTIGVLAGWSTLEGSTPDYYRLPIIKGIQSAARSRRCHTLLSWGIRRFTDANQFYPAWPVASPETDFVPVGPWNTDGLIVLTPLASESRSQYIQNLIAEGYPILFIATGEQGPQISVNNRAGIRQAMAHLVGHGHRNIAFIAGSPNDKGDSEIRLNAYRAVVEEFNLGTDPRLVVWGWHDFNQGYKAFWTLQTSGVKFTAILASNDNSAVGAMRAMHEAKIHIPGDIAIMGFDDQPGAIAQVPPLSSVHVPLGLIGEQALVMMVDHLTQHGPLESILISPRIVRRQSCGCIPEVVFSALNGEKHVQFPNLQQALRYKTDKEKQEQVVREMLNVLPSTLRFPGEEEARQACEALVKAFCQSLSEMNPVHFQTAFIDIINELERFDRSLDPWQEMISVLRREMVLLPFQWENSATLRLAEDMLHEARAAVGESAQREGQRHQYQRAIHALALNALTAQLSAALSEQQVVKILHNHLSVMGIRHAQVLFFEAEGDDPVAQSLVLDVDEDGTSKRFPSREFPPPDLYAPDEFLNLVLLPLVFQGENLGYVAFDATNDLGACAVIAVQLAATIKVAQLHKQVVDLSLTDALTGLNNRRSFELFLKNEVSRSQRFLRSLVIALVDVDNFKEYNDTYGHPAGDDALQQIGRCLSAGRRSADIVARIGGDEFVLILPETDLNGALEVCRRIRAMITALDNLKRQLSVSIGIAASSGFGVDSDVLIEQADMALYESKHNGKNRISAFQDGQALDEKEFPFLKSE
jgi:diguanylate cyclase (GGDEF)-like protein